MSSRDYLYLKGDGIDNYCCTQVPHVPGLVLEKEEVFFWDRIISDSEKEAFCYFCGTDLSSDICRLKNSFEKRYCDEQCYNQAYFKRGLWFYEDLGIFQVKSTSEKEKERHYLSSDLEVEEGNNRQKIWNDFLNYLNRIPSNEERQILLSSVKLLGLLFHQLFFEEIVSSIASGFCRLRPVEAIKPDAFSLFFSCFLRDESHVYRCEEESKKTGLGCGSIISDHNSNEGQEKEIHPETPEYHEYIHETYSFLKTLFLTGDYVDTLINIMEMKELFEKIRERLNQKTISYDEVVELVEERFLSLVNDSFTVKVWYEINYILNAYSISIFQESLFLKEMKQVALLDSIEQRKNIIRQYPQLMHDSERFFLENHDLLIPVKDDWLRDERKRIKNENQELLKEYRSLIFLSQAAELANKPTPFSNTSSTSVSYPNPFDGYGFKALILSPQYIPMQVFSSMKDVNAKEIFDVGVCSLSQTIRFDQSCYPNVTVDISRKPSEPMKLSFSANRDILTDEKLTVNIIKEKKKEGFLPLFQQKNISTNNEDCLDDKKEFAVNEFVLGNSSCSHCYYPITRKSLFPALFCQCLLCKYEENEYEMLRSRLHWIDYPSNSSDLAFLTLKRSTMVSNLQWLIGILHRRRTFVRSLLALKEGEFEFYCDSEQVTRWEEVLILGDYHMSEEESIKGMYLYILLFLDFFNYLQKEIQHHQEQQLQKMNGVGISKSENKEKKGDCWKENENWFPRLCQSFSIVILEYFLERYNHSHKSLLSDVQLKWKVKDILYICEIGNFLFPEENEHISEMVHKLKAYRSCWDKPKNNKTVIAGTCLSFSSFVPSVVSSFSYDQILSQSIYLTTNSFLSSAECQCLIKYAEDYALEQGWTTNRHYSVPTTDISLSHLSPSFHSWFMEKIFTSRIEPILYQQFYPSHSSSSVNRQISMIVNDLFIVKYQVNSSEGERNGDSSKFSGNQSYLPFHSDQSTHSFVISLNSSSQYEGGGTYFMNLFEVKNSSENVINPGKNTCRTYCLSLYSFYFSRNRRNVIIRRTSMSRRKSYLIRDAVYYCWFLDHHST
jgi:hypothetical protein